MTMPGDRTANIRVGPVPMTLLFTGFIAATYGFGVYLFPALMPEMIADFGMGYAAAGTTISLAQAGFLVSALVSGLLTGRIGAARLVLLSISLCTVCLALVPFARNGAALTALMVLMGKASASVWVPMVAIAKQNIPAAHQGKALGLMSSGTAYGLLLNGFSIPFLLPAYGWHAVWFLTAAVTGVLLVCGMPLLREGTKLVPPQAGAEAAFSFGRLLLDARNLVVPAMMFASGIACMPSQNYLVPLVQDELGHGIEAGANIWKAIGFIGMFGGFIMGGLADMITVRRALAVSYALLTVAIGLFLHHGSLAGLYLGAALFGLAFNAIFGLLPAYVSLTYPARLTAPIFGLGNVMLGLGAMAGNMMGGLIKETTGSFQASYGIAAGTALILLLAAVMLPRKTGAKPAFGVSGP